MKKLILLLIAFSLPCSAASWRNRPNPLLYSCGSEASGPADTNENTLKSWTIPGGSMGANGWIVVDMVTTQTNSGNNKTWRVKLGSTNFGAPIPTTAASMRRATKIINQNSASAQIAFHSANQNSFTVTSSSNTAGTEDTSGDLTLSLTAQKALDSEEMTIRGCTIEVWYVP